MNARNVIVTGKYGLVYKLPNLKEIIGFEIFANGVYEKESIGVILSKLPKGAVFIDIGSNIGSIALPICKIRNDIIAICVEGSPRVFGYLQFNVNINKLTNCRIINKIVAEKELGIIPFYSPLELFGKGSMTPVFTKETEHVMAYSLEKLLADEGIKKVDFIKLDIEGFEYHAFKGGEKLLNAPGAPDILFEFQDWAEAQATDISPGYAQNLLVSYGYKLYRIGRKGKLTHLPKPLLKGSEMLFASKKYQC